MNILGLGLVSLGVITLLHINSVNAPLTLRDKIILWVGLSLTAFGLVVAVIWPG